MITLSKEKYGILFLNNLLFYKTEINFFSDGFVAAYTGGMESKLASTEVEYKKRE